MRLSITALALALFVGSASAADDQTRATSDADFLVKATVCNVAEMKLSEQAADKASDPKVKEFAAKLAKEHADAGDKLSAEAKRMKVAVVAGTEKETKEKLDRLSKLSGKEYDQEYLRMMIEAHEKAIKLFESQSSGGNDPDLKKYAANMLPALKKHLEEARTLRENLQ